MSESAQVLGFVEIVSEHRLAGWAFDPDNADRHLHVTASLDGKPIGTVIAAVARPDLRSAGVGGGDHGFKIALETPLAPSALPRIEVWAVSGENRLKLSFLPNSNRSLADHASDPRVPVSDFSQKPVFVLGPARSGTSALALGLVKTGHYEGYGEGHLLPLALDMLAVVDRFYARRQDLRSSDTLLGAVHLEAFQRMVRRGFVQMTKAAYPTGRWIDKTPSSAMVRAAPLMREIWPSAKFIFLKRRVIENVASRRRKFPHETLENHYRDWADVLSAWLSVRDVLGDSAMEVEQFEIAHRPEEEAMRIANFLDMPSAASLAFSRAIASDQPERTSTEFGQVESIDTLNLTTEEQRKLMLICDPVMIAFGYGYGTEYYRFEPANAEPAMEPVPDPALEQFLAPIVGSVAALAPAAAPVTTTQPESAIVATVPPQAADERPAPAVNGKPSGAERRRAASVPVMN
jgi:hypothetical protein